MRDKFDFIFFTYIINRNRSINEANETERPTN